MSCSTLSFYIEWLASNFIYSCWFYTTGFAAKFVDECLVIATFR